MSEKDLVKTAARIAANTLSLYRVYQGYRIAERLRTDMHDPHERTWDFATYVLRGPISDKFDGWLADIAGPTWYGGLIDHIPDKKRHHVILRQLEKNGEISPNDVRATRYRDRTVAGFRAIGQLYDLSTDAIRTGKCKTALQHAAETAICSPLSYQQPELVQGLFRAASGLSVASGIHRVALNVNELAQLHDAVPRGRGATDYISAALEGLAAVII